MKTTDHTHSLFHHQGEFFIYLILLLLPSYLIRFQLFGIPLNLLDIVIVGCFGLFVLHYHASLTLGAWKYSMATFAILGAIAVLVSNDFFSALGLYKSYIIEPMLVGIMIVNVRPPLRRVLLALSGPVIFISLIGAVQYLTGYGIPAPWNERGAGFRITSVYDYPNAVGLFLAPIIAMLIAWIMHVRRNRKTFIYLMVISLLILVLARTDGALLAVIAAAGFSFGFTRWRWIALGMVALGCAAALIWAPTREIIFMQDTSGEVRRALWQGSVNLLRDHPWFGAGLAGFPALYGQYKLDRHVELLLYPHNLILDFWVELGLLGLGWLVFVIVRFFRTLRNAVTPQRIVLMSGMIAILVYGLVDVPYFKNDLAVLFWTILTMSAVVAHSESANRT